VIGVARCAREADFFTVEAWRRVAEACVDYLRAGREVAVDGSLDQRTWRTKSDEPRERVVIVARSVRFLRNPRAGAETTEPAEADSIPF
jgi:single-strand DNA-binding protein